MPVRAIRGATTVEVDTAEHVTGRVQELMREILARNGADVADLISVLFTATGDITSVFPATAARAMGLQEVPLLGAREMDVAGAVPRCVRVLVHLETDRARPAMQHVYLQGAEVLRADLTP